MGPVAQRLEQRTHNPLVLGSNPSGPTTRWGFNWRQESQPALPVKHLAAFAEGTEVQSDTREIKVGEGFPHQEAPEA